MKYTPTRLIIYAALALVFAGCKEASKQPAAKTGDRAPDFTVESIGGKTVKSVDLRGNPLVVTFMAGWCPCSKQSAPVFKEAYGIYNPQGVEFLMFGFQDTESKFEKFVDEWKFPFPAAFDKGNRIGRSYGVNAPPTTFFITRDGIIQRAFYGKIDDIAQLSSWIDELMGSSGQADKKNKIRKPDYPVPADGKDADSHH